MLRSINFDVWSSPVTSRAQTLPSKLVFSMLFLNMYSISSKSSWVFLDFKYTWLHSLLSPCRCRSLDYLVFIVCCSFCGARPFHHPDWKIYARSVMHGRFKTSLLFLFSFYFILLLYFSNPFIDLHVIV